MAERWRRTVFISPMLAPLASKARLMACLSCSVMPWQRQGQQGRAAARNQRQHHIVGRQALGQGQHLRLGGVQPSGIGHRVGGLHHFNALARHLVAVAGDDQAT